AASHRHLDRSGPGAGDVRDRGGDDADHRRRQRDPHPRLRARGRRPGHVRHPGRLHRRLHPDRDRRGV
ncbi:MAG: hypothetical protein AVDCRST_MAG61-746, partial [uncultured Friedmanniella sp.]